MSDITEKTILMLEIGVLQAQMDKIEAELQSVNAERMQQVNEKLLTALKNLSAFALKVYVNKL